jgi:uncharacterized protein (DUF1501 family)
MISRRSFLKDSLATVSLGLTVPGVFSRAVYAAAEQTYSASLAGKTLIVVQLAGGIDGLNTVVPYADGAYKSARPDLRLPDEDVLPLDDRIAFHPAMTELRDLFQAGNLSIVEGVGYPQPTFSHFKAMDIWQSADPAGAAKDGWLGRYFDGLVDDQGHPLAGLSVGRRLPSAFESDEPPPPSIESLETFGLQPAPRDRDPAARQTSLLKLYDIYSPSKSRFAALLDTTLDNAIRSSADLAAAHAAYKPSLSYPNSSLASGLRLLAELIDNNGAGTPLRVGHVTLDGFDTHTNQPQRLETLLRQTSQALSAFWQDLTAHGHADDVLVMTWSEFGRRVAQNGQEGTDHGSVVPMFLIGNSLKSGYAGEPANLTDLDNGNLRYTTDFRSVYATVLEQWLGAPADDLLGAKFPRLQLFAS